MALPVMAANDDDGLLNVYDSEGNVVNNAGQHSNSDKRVSLDSNSKKEESGSSGNFFNIDTSNYDIIDLLFNPAANVQIFNQITPLKMAAVILSAVVMTGVIIIVVIAFFLALGKIGIGALHWDAKKGWKMIEHNKAAMIVLFFAVLGTFLFSAVTIFMYEFGYKMLGGMA